MHLTPLTPAHIPDLTRLINAQIAPIPPHWTLTESQVAAILPQPSLWEIHYADEAPPDWHNEILCAVENNHVFAAARFDYTYEHGQIGMASTRWLVSDPNHPTALDLLLDHLIAKRCDTTASISINGRSDFGIGWSGIPVTDTHLIAALEAKGFVADQKWVIMTADIAHFATDNTLLPPLDPLHLKWAINESRLEWHLDLYYHSVHGEEFSVAECQSWGIPPEFAACPDYNDWMQIEWLSVDESRRRHGLARRIMIEQFGYHAARGKRRCFAYTSTDNTATINLNTSLGFTPQTEVWGWSWPYKP